LRPNPWRVFRPRDTRLHRFSGDRNAADPSVRTDPVAAGRPPPAGLGLVLLTPPSSVAILAANILIGIGYGPSAPAGSEVLLRHAPPAHRTLIFSLNRPACRWAGSRPVASPWLVARMDWRDAVMLLLLRCRF